MRRVLVTGAGGFIGRHTLRPLLGAGYEVHAVTSRPLSDGAPADERSAGEADPNGDDLRELTRELQWHSLDLLAGEPVEALMREVQPSHLLHMAWYTLPGAFWSALENLDWLQASLRLLRAFGECGGQRAVLAGTCTEYACERFTHCVEERPAPARVRAEEDATAVAAWAYQPTRMGPATLYGAAKHALHVVAERWAEQTGVALAWGRIFYAHGPYEHPARLVSGVACALLRGEQAQCTQGTQVRDYLYTPDLGSAFAALLACDVVGPVNMASGEPVRLADIVSAIAAAVGRPELVRMGALPSRPDEPERLTADIRRLRQEVGWSASVDLHEGIARTVDWWKRSLLAADAQATAAAAGSRGERVGA